MELKKLDPLLGTQVRLGIMSILMNVNSANFNYLKETLNTTQGNLSQQIKKLYEAEYIRVIKSFENNYPKTECEITSKGRKAFETYVEAIKTYLNL